MPAQIFNFSQSLRNGLFGVILAVGFLAASGCGSKAPASAPARPPVAKAGARDAAAEAKKPAVSVQSVFVVPSNSKNPFFPGSSRISDPVMRSATEPEPGRKQETAGNALVTALQAGFQGIVGVGADRVALINNATLELDRDTWLSVVLDGHEQKIRVRATKIMRGSITLLINGQPQPIVLNVFKKK